MELIKAGTIIPKDKKTFAIRNIEMPKITENEILVQVLELGLDGTDKEIGNGFYGEAPKNQKYLIVGHEAIGIIKQIGKNTKGFEIGNYVVATVRRPDKCINCINGESDMCITNNYTERGIKGKNGYFTEYYTENPDYLVKIPEEIKDIAVMLEPFSIAEKAIVQIFKIQNRLIWKPKTAVVLGSGTVGLFAAMILRLKGIDVICVDRTINNIIKNKIFSAFNITHINSTEIPISEIPKKLSKNIDIVVELTGNPTVIYDAMSIISNNGVTCLLSVTGESYMKNINIAKLNYNTVLGNKLIFGSVNSNIKHFMQGVEDMKIINSKYPEILKSMITKKIKMSEFKSYDILNNKSDIKIIIKINDFSNIKN